MTELVFHVGGGKTGSSSIQATLKTHQDLLLSEGISYWGLMLECAPIKRFTWQMPSGINEYYNQESSGDDLAMLISENLDYCEAKSIRKAVWSNEWFLGADYEFHRNQNTQKAIRRLVDEGRNVTIVAYVRDHISWAVSAFMQWGIKHKTCIGDLPDFNAYTANRPPRFYGSLYAWKKASGGNLKLFNYNAVQDVVDHFLGYLGIDARRKYSSILENRTPSRYENFLRAAFNQSLSDGKQYEPKHFDLALLAKLKQCDDRNLVSWYNSIVPDDGCLAKLSLETNHDLSLVNQLLAECGETPLNPTWPSKMPRITPTDMEKLVTLTTQLILALAKENQALKNELNSLR